LLPHSFETILFKWWWQAKTSTTAEEHDFDRLKAQLCSRFLTTDPVKDSRDQLAELKQINSAKTYSSIFRRVALSVLDLSPAESLDRYLRGLKKNVRAQVLKQKTANTEDVMRLAEIYAHLVFCFSENRHYKKPGAEFPRTAHTFSDAMEVDTLTQEKIPKLTPELKKQLKKEGRCYFCLKVGHITKTCPKKASLLVKPKAEKAWSFSSNSFSHFSFWPTTGGSVSSTVTRIT
jgi:hypothetical protein